MVRTTVATMPWDDLGTLVNRFLEKYTLQRCHAAPGSTASMAAFRPLSSSEVTSAAPHRPRATKLRKNAVQPAPLLGGDHIEAERFPPSLVVHPGGDHDGHVHYPAALVHFLGERVQRDVSVGAGFERARPERFDHRVELFGHG